MFVQQHLYLRIDPVILLQTIPSRIEAIRNPTLHDVARNTGCTKRHITEKVTKTTVRLETKVVGAF